ncbi:hypothetical protein BY458DRAFT_548690 [Sporodiniella umbellata]|nr:hypothetical protein BY458DRAFT_548690 [Sporodiniella umbellata]
MNNKVRTRYFTAKEMIRIMSTHREPLLPKGLGGYLDSIDKKFVDALYFTLFEEKDKRWTKFKHNVWNFIYVGSKAKAETGGKNQEKEVWKVKTPNRENHGQQDEYVMNSVVQRLTRI